MDVGRLGLSNSGLFRIAKTPESGAFRPGVLPKGQRNVNEPRVCTAKWGFTSRACVGLSSIGGRGEEGACRGSSHDTGVVHDVEQKVVNVIYGRPDRYL